MDLEALYTYRFAGVDQAGKELVWKEISRFISEMAGSPVRVLDPACGFGEFINFCPATEKWALDIGTDGATLGSDVKFLQMSFLDSASDLPTEHFDLVFLSNVLEHMADQNAVNHFLVRAREVLAPGGRVIVMGPNFKYCVSEYFDCADHVVALTHISIEEHLVAAGFALERTVPRFIPYSFRSRFPASAPLTRAYLRLPFVWRFFGKQFLVVGRRPER